MIRTLLKHEVHRTRGPILALFGIATLAVMVSLAMAVTRIPVISSVGSMLAVMTTAVFLVLLVLGLAVDLHQSAFGRQRYLTHALPVEGATQLWTKLLYAWLVALAGLIWFVIALYVSTALMRVAAGGSFSEAWTAQWESVVSALEAMPGWLVVTVIAGAVLMMMSYVVIVYFSVSVGSEGRFHRMGAGGPVAVFVGVYLVLQLLLVLGIVAIPLGIGDNDGALGIQAFDVATIFQSSAEVVPVGFIPVLLLVSVGLLVRTISSWRSRIALR